MNVKQCKELKKAIVEQYPQFQEMKRLEKANLTAPEKIALEDLQKKFKRVYKEAKRQYKKTSHNERNVVNIN